MDFMTDLVWWLLFIARRDGIGMIFFVLSYFSLKVRQFHLNLS